MAIQERIFQQFHYSSSANVMGSGNTHGFGVVSSSKADDGLMNEEITNIMVGDYPIVKGNKPTEYMVYVPRYQTFITIGLSNSDSIKNGRDSRFAHILMPQTDGETEFFNHHPENFIPKLSWVYEKDIQRTKHLETKTSSLVSFDLASLVKEVGFRTQGELACFIKQVYNSLFKNAQTLYICNTDSLNFRETAKKMSVLLVYLIPPKFYTGKSFAFFADSDIKSTSFVFRSFSNSLNQWTIGQHREIRGEGYEDAFYLDMAKRLFLLDNGKSFLKLREYLNESLTSEDYDLIFPVYYEMLLKERKRFSVENWKPQYIDGILYDVARGKYWELSVYLMSNLNTQTYPTKKLESWYKKWVEVAKTKGDYRAVDLVKDYLKNENPLLLEEVFPALVKEDVKEEIKEIKRPRNDNRSLEEIEEEIQQLLMPILTKEAEKVLTNDLVTLYGRVIKRQGNVRKAESCLRTAFEILEVENQRVAILIIQSIYEKYKNYEDKELLHLLVRKHFGLHEPVQIKEEKKVELTQPPKRKRKSKAPLIALLVLLLAAGGVCAAFAVKSMTKKEPVTPSTTPSTSIIIPTEPTSESTESSSQKETKKTKKEKKNVDTSQTNR